MYTLIVSLYILLGHNNGNYVFQYIRHTEEFKNTPAHKKWPSQKYLKPHPNIIPQPPDHFSAIKWTSILWANLTSTPIHRWLHVATLSFIHSYMVLIPALSILLLWVVHYKSHDIWVTTFPPRCTAKCENSIICYCRCPSDIKAWHLET